jgi:hypothetical protein
VTQQSARELKAMIAKLGLVDRLQAELRDEYWQTGDKEFKRLGALLDMVLGELDRMSAEAHNERSE